MSSKSWPLSGACWLLRSERHSIKGTGKALSCIPSCSGCSNSSSEPHGQFSGGPRSATECWVYVCVHVSVSPIQQCRVWEVLGGTYDPATEHKRTEPVDKRGVCSRHFISSELPEAKHWPEKCSGLVCKPCVSIPWRRWNPTTDVRYLVLCHLHMEIIIVLSTSQ